MQRLQCPLQYRIFALGRIKGIGLQHFFVHAEETQDRNYKKPYHGTQKYNRCRFILCILHSLPPSVLPQVIYGSPCRFFNGSLPAVFHTILIMQYRFFVIL